MNELKVFENQEFGKVRTIVRDGEPWFVAVDVCKSLEISNPSMALNRLDDDEKMTLNSTDGHSGKRGGAQSLNIVNEPGLYSLVIGSKKPEAKKFKRWITHEVIPKSRKALTSLENIRFEGSIDGIVYSKDGTPITTSRNIAMVFHKKHKSILRLIDDKRNSNRRSAQFCADHIHEIIYYDSQGRQQREYELDEYGFSYIALGLTGNQADYFKIQYINAFIKMRNSLQDMFKAQVVESVLPQDSRNRQYVYIIENIDNGAIKIGVAHNPETRLKQLQTGSVSELRIVYQSYLCSNAFDIEKITHIHFKDQHIRGEWYRISKDDVIRFLEGRQYVLRSEFCKYVSLISKLEDN